jgi:parvulin-like peptidyl-prolyl isomerase
LQASQEAGISVSEAQVEDEVRATIQAAGGEGEFDAWLAANSWTSATFRVSLRSELLAQALIEHAIGPAPAAAEQVHARHILVATEAEARDLLSRLAGGADFAELAGARSLDVTTQARGGDLGWFARGQLLAPEVEAAAFALKPGELSDVVPSRLGYHIVQTLERDPDRPLSPDQQAALYRQALERWLAEQRTQAQIERFVDTGS